VKGPQVAVVFARSGSECLQGSSNTGTLAALAASAASAHLYIHPCGLIFDMMYVMDQIKTPNPKCRLFLKIYQYRYLAAGEYLSDAPSPYKAPYSPPHTLYTCVQYTYSYRDGVKRKRDN
jgi:hypothetical protein